MKHSGWGGELQGGAQPPQAGSSRPAGCGVCCYSAAGCCVAVRRRGDQRKTITSRAKTSRQVRQPAGMAVQPGRLLAGTGMLHAAAAAGQAGGPSVQCRLAGRGSWQIQASAGSLEHQLVGGLNHRLEGLQDMGGARQAKPESAKGCVSTGAEVGRHRWPEHSRTAAPTFAPVGQGKKCACCTQ